MSLIPHTEVKECTCKVNTKLEFNNLLQIDEVLNTADIVFKPTPEQSEKYHNKKDWLQIVQDGGLLLSVLINNNVVAFAICEKRNDALHIWNVGVLPEYRKIGLWKQMHEKIVEYAKNQKFNKTEKDISQVAELVKHCKV